MNENENSEQFWSGRFQQPPNELFVQLNASISFDWRLAPYDIQGSMAHARMLSGIGVLSAEEFTQIETGLGEIMTEIARGEFTLDLADEDIHSAIEKRLIQIIGDTGKKLHTARSRNDQVATDFALFLQDNLKQHLSDVFHLMDSVVSLARFHDRTILPGYTHLQRAQPVLLAHHLLAYFEMFARDFVRLWQALDEAQVMPLGAGALAGVNYPINRDETAAELGFDRPGNNSMDDVSNRDFALDYLSGASTLSMHLSRLAAELILWTSAEFGFAEIADAFTSGSSIMPQKKNADACELIRARAAKVTANYQGLSTLLTGLPLAYNKDMQEDKLYVFDTVDTLQVTVPVMAEMLNTLQVNKDRMWEAAEGSFTLATDVADYLVGKGIPFRDAHRVVGQLVRKCIDEDKKLGELTLDELNGIAQEAAPAADAADDAAAAQDADASAPALPIFDETYYLVVDLQTAIDRKDSYGGTSHRQVTAQLQAAVSRLENMGQSLSELG
ncbi:MAG: argininosuccinate lyase [Thermoleophilia bacterium]